MERLAFLILLIPIGFLLSALFIHWAARMVTHDTARYGRALLVIIYQLLLAIPISLISVLLSGTLPIIGLMISVLLWIGSIFIDVLIIRKVYKTTFGKGFLIYILTIVLMIGGLALLIVLILATVGITSSNIPSSIGNSFDWFINRALNSFGSISKLKQPVPTILAALLAFICWIKAIGVKQSKVFLFLVAFGWTLVTISFFRSAAIGMEFQFAPPVSHLFFLIGYGLITLGLIIYPVKLRLNQIFLFAGVLVGTFLIFLLVIAPSFSKSYLSCGGRAGCFELTEEFQNEGLFALNFALVTSLECIALIRWFSKDKGWNKGLGWLASSMILPAVMTWISLVNQKNYDPYLGQRFNFLFFAEIILISIWAFSLPRVRRQIGATTQQQAIIEPIAKPVEEELEKPTTNSCKSN
jgi:hypothetical protein